MLAVNRTKVSDLPLTMPVVPDAALILGLSRSTAYELMKQNKFPIRILRIGSKNRVSRADLLAYLGETPTDAA